MGVTKNNLNSDERDWRTIAVIFAVTWPICSFIAYFAYVKESGTPELGNILAIFSFVFFAILSAFLTWVLFKMLNTSKQKALMPGVLGIFYLGYFLLKSNEGLADKSSHDWQMAITSYLPLMIGCVVVGLRHFRINKLKNTYLIPSIFGIIVALLLTFQSRLTDKLFYFYMPEMLKLDITRILPESPSGYNNYTRFIFWDRGTRQNGNIKYISSINGNDVIGNFKTMVSDKKYGFENDPHFSSEDTTNQEAGTFNWNDTVVDYKCYGRNCEYTWGIKNFQFHYSSYYGAFGDESVKAIDLTEEYAKILVKNSQYLKED